MNRPVGVTVSAIVAILGSIFALLIAAASVAALFVATIRAPTTSTPVVISTALMFGAAAVGGIWTAVGLFRLRTWARISILVFAVFMAGGCLFALLAMMAVPMPPDISGGTVQEFRQMMAITFGVPLAIAVWWLIQFNTQSTKAAFASPPAALVSRRPISITIIAWMHIVGVGSIATAILARSPAFALGMAFQGWTAGVLYAVFGALMLYIGMGLLDLQEEARILGIGWSGFSLVNAGLIVFVPSIRQRVSGMAHNLAGPNQPDLGNLRMVLSVGFGFGIIVSAATIWFLIRHRDVFGQTENS